MKIVNQNVIARKNMEIDKYWLIGFTEGDGCFGANKLKPKLRYENNIKESECSLNLDIPSKIIKNCLITGNPYKNYIFKFDSYIK